MLWYVNQPVEKERERLDLGLGLRNEVWFFNNLACPGIGNVPHPRIYTLSILGIHLAKELGQTSSAITVANAIEALSLKVTYKSLNSDDYVYRGSRAFGRDSQNLSYNFLKQSKNYVTVTYRQTTTRYLTSKFGIGLVSSGTRFSSYQLSEPAISIINGLDQVENLKSWVLKGNVNLAKFNWLSLEGISKIEKEIYNSLINSEYHNSFFSNFPNLRKNIYNLIFTGTNEKKIENFLIGDEKNAYLLSINFLEIKRLLDIEVHKAGKELNKNQYNVVPMNTLEREDMKKIIDKIISFQTLLNQIELIPEQKPFIIEATKLFDDLVKTTDEKEFISKILIRAPDYFYIEKGFKYRKAPKYNPDMFNGDMLEEDTYVPYSVVNLIKQLEFLK